MAKVNKMYVTREPNTKYYYCEWNFSKQRWEYTKKFDTFEDVLVFVSFMYRPMYSASGRNVLYVKPLDSPHPMYTTFGTNVLYVKPLDSFYADLNFSGNDTMMSIDTRNEDHPVIHYKRPKAFIDSEMRFIDIRPFEPTIRKLYDERQKRLRKRWYWHTDIPYVYRFDPVPTISKCHHYHYCRDWHTWKHDLTEYSIPEYADYMRTKAKPANKWDIEPCRHFEKSWKHQTKCRHQWEKHLTKHIDSMSVKSNIIDESDIEFDEM